MVRKKPITDEAIGALVRAQREKIGMSQPELGAALDVGAMQVSKYESGQSSLTVPKLVKVALALKCEPLDLIPGRLGA